MKNSIKYLFILFVIVGISSGCENFLTPSMDQQKSANEAIQDISDLQDAVRGIYDNLISGSAYGQDWIAAPSVMSDNAYSNANSNRYITEDQLNFTTDSGYPSSIWSGFYEVIASANYVIQSSDGLESSPEVEQLLGQAYAFRALAHMNLLMAFSQQYVDGGDSSNGIPYVTTYNKGNQYPSRDPISEVWANIGEDFSMAADLMDESNFDVTSMDYWTVKALQTRYFLYSEQYEEVIIAAEEIINSGNFSVTPASSYMSEWSSGIPESIFELVFTTSDRLANESIAYRYLNTEYGDISVTDGLYAAYNTGDVRLDLYSEDATEEEPFYRMTGKFPAPQGEDNVPVVRYAEVILNYAEALAQNSATQDEALVELTKITSNRNAPAYSTGTVENVLKERRIELAMEGAHRFYDVARTGNDLSVGDINSYRSSVITSGDYRFALPIPNDEMNANSNITQNEGYN